MNANKKILPVERENLAGFSDSIVNRKSKIANGFTLIELLVVISIIAVLAAFIFPAMGVIQKNKFITRTKAEMYQRRVKGCGISQPSSGLPWLPLASR